MQLTGLLMKKEWNRHAPVALAGDTPIRAVSNHAVQTRLAPSRRKRRRFNAFKSTFTQGFAVFAFDIHAHKPLRRGTVDDRRFVAPAVHVAMFDRDMRHQRTHFAQFFDDMGVGFPNHLAAKERQVVNVNAIALHRVEHVVKLHAMLTTGDKVIHAIRGGGVNDTSATHLRLDVLCQIDGRETIVEWVTEIDQIKILALSSSNHFALQAKAL